MSMTGEPSARTMIGSISHRLKWREGYEPSYDHDWIALWLGQAGYTIQSGADSNPASLPWVPLGEVMNELVMVGSIATKLAIEAHHTLTEKA